MLFPENVVKENALKYIAKRTERKTQVKVLLLLPQRLDV